MKTSKTTDRIEQALWQAGRSLDPFAGGPDWQNGVMAEILRIGPLKAEESGHIRESVPVWSWVAAVAACLAIGVAWYAFIDLNADVVAAGLFLDDPAGLSITTMLVEL